MPLDTSKNNQKLPVNPGEVLFTQGKTAVSLNILHEGSVRVEATVEGETLPLFSLEGANLTPGIFALLEGSSYPYTIRTKGSCVVSTYTMNQTNAEKTLTQKISVGVMALRTLLKEITELYKKCIQIRVLVSKVQRNFDNLGTSYYCLNPSIFADVTPGSPVTRVDSLIDPVLFKIRNNLANYFEMGGILPEEPGIIFLEESHGEFFGNNYPEVIDWNENDFHFIRKILNVKPNISQALFEADPSLIELASKSYVRAFRELFDLLSKEVLELKESLRGLFGNNQSLVDKYLNLLELFSTGYSPISASALLPTLQWFVEQCKEHQEEFRQIFGSNFSETSPNLEKLDAKRAEMAKKYASELSEKKAPVSVPAADGEISAGVDLDHLRGELLNSASQILSFSGADPEAVREFSSLMIKLKTFKNPLDPEPENRKIRRAIGKTYWDIHAKSFIKYKNNGNKGPLAVELMLKFGFFDESLLDESHIVELFNRLEKPKYKGGMPIHFGSDWLNNIYEKTVPTSVDELGQAYWEKLKLDLKDSNIKSDKDIPPDYNSGEARLAYEVSAMYEPNVRLTSGSVGSHFPIFTKYHVTIPLDKCYVTPEIVDKALKEIMAVDYTVFNREVIYKNEAIGIKSEFINRSVSPDFVIVPSIGNKVMMWQDLSIFRGSGSKESRGRITIPIFVTGDLKTFLMEALAAFRWELCKSVLGPDWNNVGIPSLTAEYTDYTQFFKKSKDLSLEQKEKIATEFKRFRTERDKFANDYILWVKYESEGVQRCNRVVRGIFYRHVPFAKPIRDKVCAQPAFSELHNKFKNIRNRDMKDKENKYKKYADANGGTLPKELAENMAFYEV